MVEDRQALVSMSQLDLAITCSGSLVTPRTRRYDVYSDKGTRGHAALEVATLGARWEDIRARAHDEMTDPELRRLLEAWAAVRVDLQPIPFFPTVEVALALTPDRGLVRLMGAGLGRRYDCGPGEIPGTADYFFLRQGVLTYLDVKMGNPDFGKQPSGAWQVKSMSAALWLAHDKPVGGCWGALWYPREGTKVRYHHFTPDQLEANLKELGVWLQYAARVKMGTIEADFKRGDWCRLCDSKPSCPLWRRDSADA